MGRSFIVDRALSEHAVQLWAQLLSPTVQFSVQLRFRDPNDGDPTSR